MQVEEKEDFFQSEEKIKPFEKMSNRRSCTPDKKRKKTGYILLCILLVFLSFSGGALTFYYSLDEQMRSLIKIKSAIDGAYYEEITDEKFYGVLFDAVNHQILDDYSGYLTKEEYAQQKLSAQGNQSGIGVVFLTQDADGNPQMYVQRVCGNSPAEQSGILEGDVVIGFGTSKTQIEDSVYFADFSNFLKDCVVGQTFALKIKRGTQTLLLETSKANYVENYVFYRTSTKAYRFEGQDATTLTQGGQPLASLPTDTAYIRLTQFNGNASKQFEQALSQFKQNDKKHLILDLRNNGGGYVNIMQDIASYFCKNTSKKQPLVMLAKGKSQEEKFSATGNYYNEYFKMDSQIYVLADNGTASASEALLGVMLDYGATAYQNVCLFQRNGIAKTFGKGIMQSTFPLSPSKNPDALKLTTAKLYWPVSNTCIHQKGIAPQDGANALPENNLLDGEINDAMSLFFP